MARGFEREMSALFQITPSTSQINRHKYSVTVLSIDGEDNLWIAKIIHIRVRRQKEYWVRVRWYLSPHDVAELIPSLCVEGPLQLSSLILRFVSAATLDGFLSMSGFTVISGIHYQ